MRDKDVDDIAHALLPVVSSVIATAAPTPRAMPAAELARASARSRRAAGRARRNLIPIRRHRAALERAETVCVAGSIFLAGAVRDALRQRAILR